MTGVRYSWCGVRSFDYLCVCRAEGRIYKYVPSRASVTLSYQIFWQLSRRIPSNASDDHPSHKSLARTSPVMFARLLVQSLGLENSSVGWVQRVQNVCIYASRETRISRLRVRVSVSLDYKFDKMNGSWVERRRHGWI